MQHYNAQYTETCSSATLPLRPDQHHISDVDIALLANNIGVLLNNSKQWNNFNADGLGTKILQVCKAKSENIDQCFTSHVILRPIQNTIVTSCTSIIYSLHT